jgi:O-antigen ligase
LTVSPRLRFPPPVRAAASRHAILFAAVATVVCLALAVVNGALLIATVATVILFTLALRDLSTGVLAVLASVPLQAAASLNLHGADVTWTKLAVGATLLAWTVRIVTGYSRPRLDAVAAAMGVYVLVLSISIVEAQNVSAWAGEVYRWAVALALYVAWVESLRGVRAVRGIALVTAVAVLAVAAYAAWQVATGAGPATFSAGGLTRVYATFGEPNPFAGYLEMTTLLLVALVLGNATAARRRAAVQSLGRVVPVAVVVASLAGMGALLATQSRGGYLGFAVGLGTIVWLTGGKVRWLGTVAAGICLAVALLSPLGGSVTERFRSVSLTTSSEQVTTDNFAEQERAAHWGAAVHMAESSPILGVGAGNFDERYREATTVWRFRIPRGHAHNAYLQALAQAGIVGAVSYLCLLAAVAWKIWKSLQRVQDPLFRSVVVGIAAVTVAVAVHNTVEYLHVLSLGIQLSVVWAMLKVDAEIFSIRPTAKSGLAGISA